MRQDFSNVTAARLSELFPVLLEEHNPRLKSHYLEGKAFLEFPGSYTPGD